MQQFDLLHENYQQFEDKLFHLSVSRRKTSPLIQWSETLFIW
jgi:hypothetical protein